MLPVAAALALVVVGAVAALSLLRREPAPQREFPLRFTDDEGKAIVLSKPATKVAVFAPQFTELLFELGKGEAIVGVTAGETHPAEATAIPKLVGADGITPDVAALKSSGAELVVTSGMRGAQWKTDAAAAGIVVITIEAENFNDALTDMVRVGQVVGAEQRAQDLVSRLRKEAASVSKSVRGKTPPSVFFETFPSPIIGAGPSTYLGDLVERAGGDVVATPDGNFAEFSVDQIASVNPDIYIAPSTSASNLDELKARPGFQGLRAVAEGRVYIVEDALVFRPGPRIVEGIRALAVVIHPA